MADKILTISVAAYNVDSYLEKTLDSCTRISIDTLEMLEILVIDDGSTDNTSKIGKAFELKYPRSIQYIIKKNGGHGSTVNYSMSHARGKYFMLLDGDDWVDSIKLEELIKKLEKDNIDLVLCPYNMVDNQTAKVTLVNPNSAFNIGKLYKAEEILNSISIYLAGMVIKTDILKKHPFKLQEKCFYVDMEYVTYPIPFVKTIIFYDLPVYQCRTALINQSTSRIGTILHANDHFKVAKSLVEFYIKNKDKESFLVKYVFNVTKKVIEDVFLMPFVFPITNRKIRRQICEFNEYLKRNDSDHFETTYRKKINIMRKTNYIGWQVLKIFN